MNTKTKFSNQNASSTKFEEFQSSRVPRNNCILLIFLQMVFFVSLIDLEYHIFAENISFTFRPITFCPLISQMLCSVRSPFLAAELSFTIEVIFPFLKIKPTCLVLSLCMIIVRSKGLEEKYLYFTTYKIYRIYYWTIVRSKINSKFTGCEEAYSFKLTI